MFPESLSGSGSPQSVYNDYVKVSVSWFQAAAAVLLVGGASREEGSEAATRQRPRVPFSISDQASYGINSAECVLAVIPPGKKSQCPKGRVLIANDKVNDPAVGFVTYADLNTLGTTQKSSFEAIPVSNVTVAGNDHELIALTNGDLVYMRVAWIQRPLKVKPAWFDFSYNFDKNNANTDAIIQGPGVRKGLAVWRSTDGGENFTYASTFDPALAEDGSGALPMKHKRTAAPGSDSQPLFRNGGTDGPLARVNRKNNKIYATLWCIGSKQDTSKRGYFADENKRLNKSFVLVSDDGGLSWKSLGFIEVPVWRGHIVPLENGKVCIADENALFFGTPKAGGKYQFDTVGIAPSGPAYGEVSLKGDKKKPSQFAIDAGVDDLMGATNIQCTIAFRTGEKNDVGIAYPVNLGDSGKGFALYFHDRANKAFAGGDVIKPMVKGKFNFIMHVSSIDLGSGPVLLYWYDVNSTTKSITMRGRLITGTGTHSSDFTIARTQGEPTSFDLALPRKSFGDYHQADGYIEEVPLPKGTAVSPVPGKYRYHFFPLWVQPDNTTHLAQVSYGPVNAKLRPVDVPLLVSDIPLNRWQKGKVAPKSKRRIKEIVEEDGAP